MASEDTDTLMALVSSLLTTITQPKPEEILDALMKSNGDPTAAAQLLEQGKGSAASKKRKRTGDLNDWLKSPASSGNTAGASQITPGQSDSTKAKVSESKRAQVSPFKSRPVVDLMSVLHQPSPSAQSKQPPRLPPLMLSTPSLVAQHTPCTLHLSVLPPELACRLFYTMIDASEGWKKNKWWLFDRVVESPHRTSFYARKLKKDGVDQDWQEAAQYWYALQATICLSVLLTRGLGTTDAKPIRPNNFQTRWKKPVDMLRPSSIPNWRNVLDIHSNGVGVMIQGGGQMWLLLIVTKVQRNRLVSTLTS